MATEIHEYPMKIVESHLDTFGHVNNATYLQILEEARWDWITQGGYGLDEIRRRGQGPTILEINLKFRRELINRETILIRSWAENYTGKIAVVRQEIEKSDGVLACEADFTIGLFDVKERRLIDPTDAWLACVGWTRNEWKAMS